MITIDLGWELSPFKSQTADTANNVATMLCADLVVTSFRFQKQLFPQNKNKKTESKFLGFLGGPGGEEKKREGWSGGGVGWVVGESVQ